VTPEGEKVEACYKKFAKIWQLFGPDERVPYLEKAKADLKR
jgi:hypothetical protein